MKALIFPNDPLAAYLKKGELKERYFNPNNVFDEVHFVTFYNDECTVEDIQKTIGKAKGYIHKLAPISILDMFYPNRELKVLLMFSDQFDINNISSSGCIEFFHTILTWLPAANHQLNDISIVQILKLLLCDPE